ncbi:DivIVA domain-containing protein [Aerococcaceae bacterium NML191219]|nr:DivIVA domain-containing protein [Aerococcaceae bacterium NML191219]
MGVTPIEILNKEFDKRFRGYDEEQVNDYLDIVASELDRVVKEHSELKQQLDATADKLRYFEQLQDSLNNSIVVAHEAAERLKQNARKEAELILYEAEREADRLVADANAQAQQIIANNESLRRSGQELHKQLRYMLTSQLDALEGAKDTDLLKAVETNNPAAPAKPSQPVEAVQEVEVQPTPAEEPTEPSVSFTEAVAPVSEATLAEVFAPAQEVAFPEATDADISFEEVSEFPTQEEPALEDVYVSTTAEVVEEPQVEEEAYKPNASTKASLPDYDSEERYIPEPTLNAVNATDFSQLLNQAIEKEQLLNDASDMESVLGQTIRIDLPK